MRLRGLRRTTTAIVQIIPTVDARMSHRSGATALRTETVAILNSREPILHRGHILRPAAVTQRRRARIPLLLAAVTAAEAATEARHVAIVAGVLPAMAGAVVVMAVEG